MTHLYESWPIHTWYASFICDMPHSHVTCIIRMRFHSYSCDTPSSYVTLIVLHHYSCMCDITYSICVTWPIHMCDMIHPCMTWLVHMWHSSFTCDMPQAHSRDCIGWQLHMRGMTHPYMWHDSFEWQLHMRGMTHPLMWHDSLACPQNHWCDCNARQLISFDARLYCYLKYAIADMWAHLRYLCTSFVDTQALPRILRLFWWEIPWYHTVLHSSARGACLCMQMGSRVSVGRAFGIPTSNWCHAWEWWLIHEFDMHNLYAWHASFACVAWLMNDALRSVTWRIQTCDKTHYVYQCPIDDTHLYNCTYACTHMCSMKREYARTYMCRCIMCAHNVCMYLMYKISWNSSIWDLYMYYACMYVCLHAMHVYPDIRWLVFVHGARTHLMAGTDADWLLNLSTAALPTGNTCGSGGCACTSAYSLVSSSILAMITRVLQFILLLLLLLYMTSWWLQWGRNHPRLWQRTVPATRLLRGLCTVVPANLYCVALAAADAMRKMARRARPVSASLYALEPCMLAVSWPWMDGIATAAFGTRRSVSQELLRVAESLSSTRTVKKEKNPKNVMKC